MKHIYAKVIRHGDLKKKLLEKLKTSPVAMILHKSQSYRTIFDLSFQLQHRGTMMQSVNSAKVKNSSAEAMINLVQCVKRLIAILADKYDENTPVKFRKTRH